MAVRGSSEPDPCRVWIPAEEASLRPAGPAHGSGLFLSAVRWGLLGGFLCFGWKGWFRCLCLLKESESCTKLVIINSHKLFK